MRKPQIKWRILVCLLVQSIPAIATADCFDGAGEYHKVNPWVLRAIAQHESGNNPSTIVKNTNGTSDYGKTGINSVHLPELARYSITKDDLMDGCKSVYVAGWHLRRKIVKHGNTWTAIGAYHSETPRHRDRYARIIKNIIDGWVRSGRIPQP